MLTTATGLGPGEAPTLGVPEGQALRELGSHLGFDEREVDTAVGEVITSVKSALGV